MPPNSLNNVGSSPQSNVAASVQPHGASQAGEMSDVKSAVSKAALKTWKQLSASLVSNPSENWHHAIETADALAKSVCGQKIPEDLRSDILGNLNLLEQTLNGLKLSPTNDRPNPHGYIKEQLSIIRLSVVTNAQDLSRIQSIGNPN